MAPNENEWLKSQAKEVQQNYYGNVIHNQRKYKQTCEWIQRTETAEWNKEVNVR